MGAADHAETRRRVEAERACVFATRRRCLAPVAAFHDGRRSPRSSRPRTAAGSSGAPATIRSRSPPSWRRCRREDRRHRRRLGRARQARLEALGPRRRDRARWSRSSRSDRTRSTSPATTGSSSRAGTAPASSHGGCSGCPHALPPSGRERRKSSTRSRSISSRTVSTQEGLLAELPRPAGRVLFAAAEERAACSIDELGADFVPLYRTRRFAPDPFPEADLVVLASGSAARAYAAHRRRAPGGLDRAADDRVAASVGFDDRRRGGVTRSRRARAASRRFVGIVTASFHHLSLRLRAHDDFVGTCHGVIKRIAPGVGDHRHHARHRAAGVLPGALVLRNTLAYLPVGVHLAVVDPGVGGSRRPLALRDVNGDLFVGPGQRAARPRRRASAAIESAHELANPAYALEPVSRTFHGRDLFSPAAAHLALGVELGRARPAACAGRARAARLAEPVVGRGHSRRERALRRSLREHAAEHDARRPRPRRRRRRARASSSSSQASATTRQPRGPTRTRAPARSFSTRTRTGTSRSRSTEATPRRCSRRNPGHSGASCTWNSSRRRSASASHGSRRTSSSAGPRCGGSFAGRSRAAVRQARAALGADPQCPTPAPAEAALDVDRVAAAARPRPRHGHRRRCLRVAAHFPEAEVVGADLSDRMIEEARRKVPTDSRVVSASRSPMRRGFRFATARFDLVTLMNMIPFFDELARVTAPGRRRAVFVLGWSGDADLRPAGSPARRARRGEVSRNLRILRQATGPPSLPARPTALRVEPSRSSRRGRTGPDP